MGRQRYTDEQVIKILREGEAEARISELCRKHGVSDATCHRWKAKYAGLSLSELKQLKTLEDENCRLKQIVPEQSLDNRVLKDMLSSTFNARGEAASSILHCGKLRA